MNSELTFTQLIAHSGDSKLLWYVFQDGQLRLELEVDEFDAVVKVTIRTPLMRVNQLYEPDSRVERVLRTCKLELLELTSLLQTQNGYYIPAKEFGQMMKEVRSGAGLAYGESMEKIRFLLRVKGYGELISCLVGQQEDITWAFASDN